MSNSHYNRSKIVGLFTQDSLVPKNFNPSNRNAKLNNIVLRRACYVPVILLTTPFKIIAKQNNLSGVRFYREGMSISVKEHDTLIGLLINSVKYN
jgi:hypothetical protein